MTRGTEQKILIDSNPQGSLVTVDGWECGITPQCVALNRKYPHKVLIEKSGYQPSAYYLQPQGKAAAASNVLIPIATGALGAGVGLICAGGAYGGILIPGFALIGVMLGSVFGIVGAGIDLYTGAANTLSTEKIHAELHQ